MAIFSDAAEVAALVRDTVPPEVVGLLDLGAVEAQPSDFTLPPAQVDASSLALRHAHMNDLWETLDDHRALLRALLRRRGSLPTLQVRRCVMEVSESAPSEAL